MQRTAVWLILFACALWIYWNLPYAHDDWHWGLPDRVKLMKNGFAHYNGRHIANLLIMAGTRNGILKVLIPVFWMMWLVYAAWKTAAAGLGAGADAGVSDPSLPPSERITEAHVRYDTLVLLGTICMVTAIPASLFAASYGWLSAFVNYVPPTVLFLVWFHRSEWIYDPDAAIPVSSPLTLILFLVLGWASQLFAEHSTMMITLYALWAVLLPLLTRKKVPLFHLTYLAGCIAGAVTMFSNPVYIDGTHAKGTFKAITLSVGSMYYKLRDEMLDWMFFDNVLLSIVLAVLVLLLVIRSARYVWVQYLTIPVLCVYPCYVVCNQLHPEWVFSTDPGRQHTVQLLLGGLFVLAVLAGIIGSIASSERWKLAMLYICAFGAAMPLTAANPIGARCFYFSYILQAAAAVRLAAYLLSTKETRVTGRQLRMLILTMAGLSLCLAVFYVRIFTEIGIADRERTVLTEQAVETDAQMVRLPVLPYADFTWTTEPQTDGWLKYYKKFYGIPEEMNVYFF